MTRVFLARHGETIWHSGNRYAGLSDIPLTEHGRCQAEALASWARQAELSAVWVSPLSRARETAAAVARALQIDPQVDQRLRELNFGEGEGLTLAGMAQRFGERLALFEKDPVTHHLPGGEDPVAAAERGAECLHEIASRHPGQRVLVVAHNTLCRLVLCRLLFIPLARYRKVFASVRNHALIEIAIEGDDTTLLQFNVPLPDLPS